MLMGNIKNTIVKPFMTSKEWLLMKRKIGPSTLPDRGQTFRAFDMEAEEVRLVVVGAEPYRDGSADGLAFSSFKGWKDMHPVTAALLTAIRKQLYDYMGEATFKGAFPTGNLLNWKQNGALLMNSILCADPESKMLYKDIGWQRLTEEILRSVLETKQAKAVLLIGKRADELFQACAVEAGSFKVWRLPLSAEGILKDESTFVEIHQYLLESYDEFPFWKYEHKDYNDVLSFDVDALISSIRTDITVAQVPIPKAKNSIAELKTDALKVLAELGINLKCNINYVFDFRTKL